MANGAALHYPRCVSLTGEDWLLIVFLTVLCLVLTGIGMWSGYDGPLGWLLRWRDRGTNDPKKS